MNPLLSMALRRVLTKVVETGVAQGKATLVKRADEAGITRDLGIKEGEPLKAPPLATPEDRQAAVRAAGKAAGKLLHIGRNLTR